MEDLDKLLEMAGKAEGYMVTITLFSGGKLETTLVTEKFNKLDMLPSLKKAKNLVIEQLEAEEIAPDTSET